MNKQHLFFRFVLLVFALVGSVLFLLAVIPAEAAAEPRLLHKACTTHCVYDQTILRSSMGDTQAKNAYFGWYDTYYEMTGCSDSAIRNVLELAIDIIGDVVGAGGGSTMQCWQGLMAQASLCSDSCSEYFVTDGKYGPNVRVTLNDGVPGALAVTLSNNDYGYLPEEQPNAYSLKFYLNTTLQYEDGPALMVDHTFMNSMSYANWITRGGMDDCITSYGMDDERCQILAGFDTPNVIPAEVSFMDGALYDISSYARSSGANYSFEGDGFILLDSNGEYVTISQGPFSGYAWTKVHNKDTGAHTSQLTAWDATYGPVTITNHECNAFWCSIGGDQTDADTYVFALQGPAEYRMTGEYTIQVEADIIHDKDYANNLVSYTYTADEVGAQLDESIGQEEEEEPAYDITDLPVIDLPGTGTYIYTLPDDLPGMMFRLHVSEDMDYGYITLTSLDSGNFLYFGKTGSIPVPEYPKVYSWSYSCTKQSGADYSHSCMFEGTADFDYYLFVSTYGTGRQFQLDVVMFTDQEIEATQAYVETQQAQATLDNTPQYAEVEPNDTKDTANFWDMNEPFTGVHSGNGDYDYLRITFNHPGIYTFTLTDSIETKSTSLLLIRGTNHNVMDSFWEKEDPIVLTMDGSPGESYIMKIGGYKDSTYELTLTGFISDPDEPNDERAEATEWDITAGPIQGYYFDGYTGAADYYKIIGQETVDDSDTVFTVTNPTDNLRVCMKLLNAKGNYLSGVACTPAGEPNTISYLLSPGVEYYLRVSISRYRTTIDPYTLSASYQPVAVEDDEIAGEGIVYRLKGHVNRMWGPIPIPVSGVEVYAQIDGGQAILLDTTGFFGYYGNSLNLAEGQEVRIWAVMAGTNFDPEEEVFYPELNERSHTADFIVVGGQVLQETPPEEFWTTLTPVPPLIQTALVTTATPAETETLVSTPLVTVTPTMTPTPSPQPSGTPTMTPTVDYADTTIFTGTLWRLFADSDPVGIAAAEVILSVNGVDWATASSMIDGTYLITLEGIQPGDTLQIRAHGAEDVFEPIYYEWQAEAGVDKWDYEFYSYWDEITPPAEDDQNRIYGWVLDGMGQGVPGVYVNVRMGNSDSLQRIGPTDENGYFNGMVYLPSRIMVTVWVEGDSFLPSRLQFFHAYYLEDRQIVFRQWSGGIQ